MQIRLHGFWRCNPAVIAEIKKWSWKLDCVQLAHCLVLGSAGEREQEEVIRGRDYFEESLYGSELKKNYWR